MIVTEKSIDSFDSEVVDSLTALIEEGEILRYGLGDWGWLYVEGKLPFLLLYRPPEEERSWESEYFVLTEASCLVIDPAAEGIHELINGMAGPSLKRENDAYLVLEIRNDELIDRPEKSKRPHPQAGFTIYYDPDDDRSLPVAEAFEKAAGTVEMFDLPATAETIARLPDDVSPITDPRIIHLVVDIRPIHVNPATDEPFPVVLQLFRRKMSDVLREVVYEFEQQMTHLEPTSYRSLGRHEVLLSDWMVDRKLTEIADSFAFLLEITPVNQHEAWKDFVDSGYREAPDFYYRRLTIDPEVKKGELYRIPVDEVEDPLLCHLFREKRAELARMLTMLEERDTPRFIYSSLQLYGTVEPPLLELAIRILEEIEPPKSETPASERVGAEEFAGLARAELEYYLNQLDGVTTTVEILPEVTSLIVSNGVLCVPKSLSLPKSRVRALINHEVGTHIVTWLNGKSQKLEQLYTGLAGYDELQEGLAVLAEYFVGQLSDARLRLLAGRVIAAYRLTEHGSFVETFEELVSLGFRRQQAFGICVRVWRGGGLTKDAIYLRGLANLLDWIVDGGNIDLLYLGKITESHIPLMMELLDRQILHPPPLRPRYLDEPETRKKLESLTSGCSVLDLRSAN